jgi:hypothetical protein
MARFKVRDLVISVLPESAQLEECPLNSFCPKNTCGFTICVGCTQSFTCLGCTGALAGGTACAACTLNITDCTPVTICGLTPCHPAITNTGPLLQLDREALNALRNELQRELAELDKRAEEIDAGMAPKTLAEAETLEKKLSEALDEVRRRKADLGKKR